MSKRPAISRGSLGSSKNRRGANLASSNAKTGETTTGSRVTKRAMDIITKREVQDIKSSLIDKVTAINSDATDNSTAPETRTTGATEVTGGAAARDNPISRGTKVTLTKGTAARGSNNHLWMTKKEISGEAEAKAPRRGIRKN